MAGYGRRLRNATKNARRRADRWAKDKNRSRSKRKWARKREAFWERKLARFRKNRAVRAASDRLYGGSRGVTNRIIGIVGDRAPVTSRKRWECYGNCGSDHNFRVTNADAVDFGIAEAHELADEVARRLGGPNEIQDYQNFIISFRGKQFRVQLIASQHGTGPHFHGGVKRV